MKRNKKSINVLFLGMFIALVVIAIAGINMRTLINSNGVTRIAKKAGANDAIAQDVLENYTFTSDTAGINQEGTIKDYSEYEGRFKLLATAAPESKIYNLTLSPGYYTHINVDATDVYNEGYDDGYDNGHDEGIEDTAKTWVYDHATQTVTKGNQTFDIGDYIYYRAPISSGYTGKWRLLGVDDRGQMLLVSENNVVNSLSVSGDPYGANGGYLGAIDYLNDLCKKYADNVSTESGRSINAYDINKITGYNPANITADDPYQTGTGNAFTDMDLSEWVYGNHITYTNNNGVFSYRDEISSPNTQTTPNAAFHRLKLPNQTESITNSTTIKVTNYKYNVTATNIGLSTQSKIYDMITDAGNDYFLATNAVSPHIDTFPNSGGNYYFIGWGILVMYIQSGQISGSTIWSSAYDGYPITNGLRAVVSLKLGQVPQLDN